eukprot:5691773-Alexandrium_andersonii.AAC.1
MYVEPSAPFRVKAPRCCWALPGLPPGALRAHGAYQEHPVARHHITGRESRAHYVVVSLPQR